MKTAHAKATSKLWLLTVATSLGLLITTAVAANRQVSFWEAQLLDIVYGLPAPLTEAIYVLTQAGGIGAVLAVSATALVFKRRKLSLLILANSLVAYVITAIVKELIARPRPAEIIPDIVVRLEYVTGFGFPSGHTAIASAMALTLMPHTARKYHWLLWFWIAGVGFSRLYLGVHAPLDLLGGFFVGSTVALGARLLEIHLNTLKKR